MSDVNNESLPVTSTPIGSTPSGRSIYPQPAQNPACVCPNPMAAFFCATGHMLECHYPMTCREADCSHMDRYESADEED